MSKKEKRLVPALRFPSFANAPAWQESKLAKFLHIPKKEKIEITSKEQLLTVKLHLGGVVCGACRDTLSLNKTNYYIRKAGQFIYGKQNFFNGSMGIIPKEFDGKATSGDVPSFDIKGIEPKFLYMYLSQESFYKKTMLLAYGTGSKRIHESVIQSFKIKTPSIEEQKKIADCLSSLDTIIENQTNKIEKLKQHKKALMQQLFV